MGIKNCLLAVVFKRCRFYGVFLVGLKIEWILLYELLRFDWPILSITSMGFRKTKVTVTSRKNSSKCMNDKVFSCPKIMEYAN